MAHTPDPLDDLIASGRYAPLIQRIRQFMRDYEELNRLILGKESSDRDVAAAIMFVVDDINMTPPPVTKTLDQMIQANWTGLIVAGVVLHLVKSALLHYQRNDLKFNDNGLMTNGLSGRVAEYQGFIQMNEPHYENYKTRIKVSANLTEMMDASPMGVPSEFGIIHGWRSFYP